MSEQNLEQRLKTTLRGFSKSINETMELLHTNTALRIGNVMLLSIKKNNSDSLFILSPEELEILQQSLGARKKLLRGKIRNNQSHMAADDKPDWSEKDYLKAINMRKRQLADADMLLTRLQNL